MTSCRTIGVLLGLGLAGLVLGAAVGLVVIAIWQLAIDVRLGNFERSWWWETAAIGAMFGGVCGAVLAPTAAFTPWRHVPLARLFTHVSIGTTGGGALVALLFPIPGLVVLGGMLGFLLAGNRAAARSRTAHVLK